MTPTRQKRLYQVLLLLVGLFAAAALALKAFDENMMFFYSPTQIKAGEAVDNKAFRVGGLVVEGSVQRQAGELAVLFDLTDNESVVTVHYNGILPDLFRENQGIIARGKLGADGIVEADEVLAKHDENYMPPEVKAALEAGSI